MPARVAHNSAAARCRIAVRCRRSGSAQPASKINSTRGPLNSKRTNTTLHRSTHMKASELFGGKSLKSEDILGREPVVTIESVDTKKFDDGPKAIIKFVGKEKA